jgi:hypothetical protein
MILVTPTEHKVKVTPTVTNLVATTIDHKIKVTPTATKIVATTNEHRVNVTPMVAKIVATTNEHRIKTSRNVVQTVGVPDKTFVYDQSPASANWTINHGMNKVPSPIVYDSAGNEMVGVMEIVDNDTVIMHFTGAFTGTCYLN